MDQDRREEGAGAGALRRVVVASVVVVVVREPKATTDVAEGPLVPPVDAGTQPPRIGDPRGPCEHHLGRLPLVVTVQQLPEGTSIRVRRSRERNDDRVNAPGRHHRPPAWCCCFARSRHHAISALSRAER